MTNLKNSSMVKLYTTYDSEQRFTRCRTTHPKAMIEPATTVAAWTTVDKLTTVVSSTTVFEFQA